ncbi:MAG: DUF2442 domain-containing protein [Planctomycetes bacterium]|nr:DUF2442 domain-containing protein [Planctomycetota bacterium]
MSTSVTRGAEAMAVDVRFDAVRMRVRLLDGREVIVPLAWFPKLRDATSAQRRRWRLIGKGVGIHWDGIDEDLSVSALLNPGP